LVKADIDGLTAVTQEKARAVNQMAELTNMRYQALTAAGFAAKEDGMRAWLKSSAQPEAEKCWADLLQLAHSAKSLNNTNGLLIGKHMMHNQSALNVLLGTRNANLYGPDGQSATKIRSRGLVVG
jgi:flagella synthesis protein FlgN